MLQGKGDGDGEETCGRGQMRAARGVRVAVGTSCAGDTEQFNRHVLNNIPGEGGLNRD